VNAAAGTAISGREFQRYPKHSNKRPRDKEARRFSRKYLLAS
jgi:hypothetical protein